MFAYLVGKFGFYGASAHFGHFAPKAELNVKKIDL